MLVFICERTCLAHTDVKSMWPVVFGAVVVVILWYLDYNYLCSQCLSPLKWGRIPLMARCTRFNSLSMTCQRLVVFSSFPTNKDNHHDITEILLKVVQSTLTHVWMWYFVSSPMKPFSRLKQNFKWIIVV